MQVTRDLFVFVFKKQTCSNQLSVSTCDKLIAYCSELPDLTRASKYVDTLQNIHNN